jgi:hypothetical protein
LVKIGEVQVRHRRQGTYCKKIMTSVIYRQDDTTDDDKLMI